MRRRARLDLLHPGIVFAALLYAYSIASALYVREHGTTEAGFIIDNDTLVYYYISCLLGLAGLGFGVLWGTASGTRLIWWTPSWTTFTNKCQNRKLVFYALSVGVLLAPFYYKFFNPADATLYSERAYAMRVEQRADSFGGLLAALTQQAPSLLLIGCATYFMFRSRNILLKFSGMAIVALYLATNTMSGWRGVVIQGAAIPVIFFHYRVRRLSFLSLMVLGLGTYIFMDLAAISRSARSPGQMIAAIEEKFAVNGSETLNAEQNGELMTATNLMTEISALQSGELQFNYGTGIFTELAVYVPRAFYPDRPLPLSELYLKILYPDVLDAGAGYGFFCLQEGYWAFGVAGVFLFMLVYGWALAVVYRWYQRFLWSDLAALLYSTIFYDLVVAAVRTGLLSSIKNMLIGAIPFLFVMMMPDLFGSNQRRSSGWGVKHGRGEMVPVRQLQG
jgi:oligosaccharide repeat unit polymerase